MDFTGFESRKRDHIRLALEHSNEALGQNGLDTIHLMHRALPNLNLSEVELQENFWQYQANAPFFISSMTAGHEAGEALNACLATVAGERRWPMGIGSQRRELHDNNAVLEVQRLRKLAPKTFFFSNIGLAQIIENSTATILRLVDSLEAGALIVHCNALQEALQREGTPNFRQGVEALAELAARSPVPVIVKETGCGFSVEDFFELAKTNISVVDVSGFGGTHWGRIEGARALADTPQEAAAKTFGFWGESTVDSLLNGADYKTKSNCRFSIWASGGIRSGLDAAKCIALGAEKIGFAKPALQAALNGESALAKWMEQMEFELRVALFCTGSKNSEALRKGTKWRKI